MKNAIAYYYNLNINNIHQTNKIYKFGINNNYYVLEQIDDVDINEVYNLSLYLKNKGIYTHEIIMNIEKNIVTIINNKKYVLLKIKNNLDRKVNIDDIVNFSMVTNIEINKKDNWYKLWINKMDYFEYQINELKNKYPLIKESFNYFSGLTETGIELLENIKPNTTFSICHKRIKKDYTLFDLYNPLNFIIDYSIRDVSEYFKEIFLFEDPYDIIEKYIGKLNNQQLILFFIRMIYPSFYFDTYEEIIKNNLDETKIQVIINRVDEYEKLIKKTYILIKNICSLPEIEWLIK